MATTASASKFRSADRDDFNAGLAQKRVGMDIAIVTNDDTRLQGDDIVAVVPLFAFLFKGVASGTNNMKLGYAEALLDKLENRFRFGSNIDCVGFIPWPQTVTA